MTRPGHVEAVLFDVDDTLFDRRRAQSLVLARLPTALPELLSGIEPATLEAAWLQSDRDTADHTATVPGDIRASRNERSAAFLEHLGLDRRRADAITDAYLHLYPAVRAPVAGAAQTVAACAARFPVGVVSNAFPDVQYRKLATLGLMEYFDCIVLSEEYDGPRKPAPGIFRHACDVLACPPPVTLYVGDSWVNDVLGAHAAGLIPCWYNPEASAPPPGHTAPAWQLRRLTDLVARLETGGHDARR